MCADVCRHVVRVSESELRMCMSSWSKARREVRLEQGLRGMCVDGCASGRGLGAGHSSDPVVFELGNVGDAT